MVSAAGMHAGDRHGLALHETSAHLSEVIFTAPLQRFCTLRNILLHIFPVSIDMRPFGNHARSLFQGTHLRPVPTCPAQCRPFRISTCPLSSNKIQSNLVHPVAIWPRNRLPGSVRHESNSATSSTAPPQSRLERDQVPSYELTFTCNVCKTRSSHRLSKQGYHHGTVLIACPECKNRHLISDHLKVRSKLPLEPRGFLTGLDLLRQVGYNRGSYARKG